MLSAVAPVGGKVQLRVGTPGEERQWRPGQAQTNLATVARNLAEWLSDPTSCGHSLGGLKSDARGRGKQILEVEQKFTAFLPFRLCIENH